MHVASIGIDLGKTTFHRVALDEQGNSVLTRKLSRKPRHRAGKLHISTPDFKDVSRP